MNRITPTFSIFLLASLFSTSTLFAVEEEEDKPSEVDVYVNKIEPTEVFDSIKYGGFVRSGEVRELFTPVEGHLEKVLVVLGQKVKKGDRLYIFNPVVAGQVYNKQVVRAPMSGTISQIASHQTNRYKAGDTLMMIADVKNKSVRIQVTYSDMMFMKAKPPLVLTAHANTENEAKVDGTILAISPAADPLTSTFAVDIQLHDEKNAVPVGTYVDAEFKKNVRKSIVIPITALNRKRDKVYIVKGKVIEPVKIELGRYFAETVEVKTGLKAGSTLVTKYAEKPKKGDTANILKPKVRKEKIDSAASEASKSRG